MVTKVAGKLKSQDEGQLIDGMEIAKKLKVNQSSITKSLHGNVDYHSNGKTVYGGSKKKLNKIIQNDPKILDILQRMNKIREEKW